MKKTKQSVLIFFAVLLSSAAMLSGCTFLGRQVYFSGGTGLFNVFVIGDETCTESEAKVYLANYRNLYGTAAGEELFSGSFDTDRLEKDLKSDVLYHLTMVASMDQYAKNHDMALDTQEEGRVKDAAKAYYSTLSDDDRKYLGTDEEDLRTCYEKLALAEKVHASIMGNVDEEVSEDEARVVVCHMIMVSTKETADLVAGQLAAGTDFDVLSAYNEGKSFDVNLKRNEYPKEVEDAAFALEDGQTAGPVEASDGKWYFISCVSKYDEALSEQNKSDIITQRQADLIETIMKDQDTEDYSELNTGVWDRITFPSEAVQTDAFFSTLHRYISF